MTPTGHRLEQKADLTRLAQTIAHVPNLFWLVVEDTEEPSTWIQDILTRSKLAHAHLAIATPLKMKLKDADPSWKLPKGVVQRNAALQYIRFVCLTKAPRVLFEVLEPTFKEYIKEQYILGMMITPTIGEFSMKLEMSTKLEYGRLDWLEID